MTTPHAERPTEAPPPNVDVQTRSESEPATVEPDVSPASAPTRKMSRRSMLMMLTTFGLGVGVGYFGRDLRIQTPEPIAEPVDTPDAVADALPVNVAQTSTDTAILPVSYEVAAQYGQLGPQLLEVGAIDYDLFAAAQQRAGHPLTQHQIDILREGSDDHVVFEQTSAYFLLNFFWALGLANRNPILTEGLLARRADGDISGFASTGGWTAGTEPATELYASALIQTLSFGQQGRLETVASGVYRPCCNNPTNFPDCNHGMAMLGLLEVVAATDANLDELYTVAKNANRFWYPQQAAEVATFFRFTQGRSFDEIDARAAVAPEYFSSSGYRQVNQWLAQNSLLQGQTGGGSGCSL
jgi:hypothetical protein